MASSTIAGQMTKMSQRKKESQSVTLRDKVHSYEIRKALNVEPLLRIQFLAMIWYHEWYPGNITYGA